MIYCRSSMIFRSFTVDHVPADMRACAVQAPYVRVQIQPLQRVLDDADRTVPTRQHELNHTDLSSKSYIIK